MRHLVLSSGAGRGLQSLGVMRTVLYMVEFRWVWKKDAMREGVTVTAEEEVGGEREVLYSTRYGTSWAVGKLSFFFSSFCVLSFDFRQS